MTILLRWLVDHVWIFYVGCAIGALIYLVRAFAAQRERSLAMFTLEHETATVRAVRAWAMVFLFIAVSLVIFIGIRLAMANSPMFDPTSPLPTPTPNAGVELPTPGATPTLTDSLTMPTFTPPAATLPPATLPANPTSPPTAAPTQPPAATPVPTAVAAGPLSGSLNVRFGDFGALVGWELSSSEVTVGQHLVLTLYWQGLEGQSPTNYTVFTHLFSQDGQLIAQHDSPPASGASNTSDWQAGETIRDTHSMTFKSGVSGVSGPATILVGLYDPQDVGNRVMTSEGQDHVVLPVTVNVTPQ
jgi:hypothetical protein